MFLKKNLRNIQKSSFIKTTFRYDFKIFFLKVVFTKDDFHVFKGARSETFFSYFDQMLFLENTIFRNIKILSKVVFSKDDF
jgi:hypothetical protein